MDGDKNVAKVESVDSKEDPSIGRLLFDAAVSGVTAYGCYGIATALAPESMGVSLLAIPVCVIAGVKTSDVVDDLAFGKPKKK